jgi:hypothetical protein
VTRGAEGGVAHLMCNFNSSESSRAESLVKPEISANRTAPNILFEIGFITVVGSKLEWHILQRKGFHRGNWCAYLSFNNKAWRVLGENILYVGTFCK